MEDSAAEAGLLREALRDFPDLLVTSVSSGATALAYLRDHCDAGPDSPRPDLVLLDLNLACPDGRRVLADIKSDPDLHAVPVIVLSSSTGVEDFWLACELGASAYVVKPVQLQHYQAVVRAIYEFWCGAAALPASHWRNDD